MPDWLAQLQRVLQEEMSNQHSLGENVNSGLWYTLIRSDFEETLWPKAFHGASAWPAGDPKRIADEPSAVYPVVRFADGDLAAALRKWRDLWVAGEIGLRASTFIPVVQPDTTKYELRMRAATTIDDDGGVPVL